MMGELQKVNEEIFVTENVIRQLKLEQQKTWTQCNKCKLNVLQSNLRSLANRKCILSINIARDTGKFLE